MAFIVIPKNVSIINMIGIFLFHHHQMRRCPPKRYKQEVAAIKKCTDYHWQITECIFCGSSAETQLTGNPRAQSPRVRAY